MATIKGKSICDRRGPATSPEGKGKGMRQMIRLALVVFALSMALAFAPVPGPAKIESNPLRISSKEAAMIQGMRTVIYHVPDIKKAKGWYSAILGIKPYFDEPYYVGFNVGGFELGLDPDMTGVSLGSNQIAYWGVQNADDSLKSLLDLGAKTHSEVKSVGSGPKGDCKVATVVDPFGNIFGIIENPYFKLEDVR
jgi:predicted enzyme related to lactoylglutathione lyase